MFTVLGNAETGDLTPIPSTLCTLHFNTFNTFTLFQPFSGAIAVLPLGTMGSLTQGVVVQQHAKGSDTFTYAPPTGTAGKGHLNVPYFFEGPSYDRSYTRATTTHYLSIQFYSTRRNYTLTMVHVEFFTRSPDTRNSH